MAKLFDGGENFQSMPKGDTEFFQIWSVRWGRTDASMSFSANRRAYCPRSSFSSQSATCCIEVAPRIVGPHPPVSASLSRMDAALESKSGSENAKAVETTHGSSSLARRRYYIGCPRAGARARLGRASDVDAEEWERVLREEYAAERRCDEDRAAALRVRTRS